MNIQHQIFSLWEKKYGYTPELWEVLSQYRDGNLSLETDEQEDYLSGLL